MIRIMRQDLLTEFTERRQSALDNFDRLRREPLTLKRLVESWAPPTGETFNPAELLEEIEIEMMELELSAILLREAKTVLFPQEQANIFLSIANSYHDGLEYKLPFKDMVIQFDKPIPVRVGEPDQVVALLLRQGIITESVLEETRNYLRSTGSTLRAVDAVEGDNLNTLVIVFADHNIRKVVWTGSHTEIFETNDKKSITDGWASIRNLAVACVGYINCENVYLHRQGEVDPAVNRKREKKGKTPLEAYYVCRIRGVQYLPDGREKSPGSAHGFRYDVRGHFRRLDAGKVTWVRPHQRGLAHELYIPKVYAVTPRKVDERNGN